MRMRLPVFAAALLLAVSPVLAVEPTLELRVRSVNDLLDKAEYVAGTAGKEDSGRQLRDLIRALATEKEGLEGLSITKPFGLYATVAENPVESPVVAMIPIASEARFLQTLKDRLGLTPEKAESIYQLKVPSLPEPVRFRFSKNYAYAALRAKDLEPSSLADPKTFFAKDDGAVASLLLRLDRIPDNLKTVVLGQLELQLNDARKKQEAGETPAERKAKESIFDGFAGAAQNLAREGKELSLRLLIDPKTDELTAEWSLTPKPGTKLATALAADIERKSLPFGMATAPTPVLQAAWNFRLPEAYRQRYEAVVDGLLGDIVRQADDAGREAAQRLTDALAPTLKAGLLDAAVVVTGPDANARHGLLAALAVKEGKGIAQLLKDFAPLLPADEGRLTFEVETLDGFALHKFEWKAATANFKFLFGTQNFWLATSADMLVLSIEEDGTTLKKALRAKSAVAPLVSFDLGLARLLPLVQRRLTPDEHKNLARETFGEASPAGRDTLRLTVHGGDRLTVRLVAKGKALRLVARVDEFMKK